MVEMDIWRILCFALDDGEGWKWRIDADILNRDFEGIEEEVSGCLGDGINAIPDEREWEVNSVS